MVIFKKGKYMKKNLIIASLVVLGALFLNNTSSAQVSWGVNVQFGGGGCYPYVAPPVYYPQPIYYAPAPAYYGGYGYCAPVYYRPAVYYRRCW